MTPDQVLEKHRSLVAVNSETITLGLTKLLNAKSEHEKRKFFGGSHTYGFTWLFRDDSKYPGKVMETVVSPQGGAITSVYINHSSVVSLGELANSREQLIKAVAEKVGLSVGAVGVDDTCRGRVLGLAELATAQLIDLLADKMGKSIAVASNIGGSKEIMEKVA